MASRSCLLHAGPRHPFYPLRLGQWQTVTWPNASKTTPARHAATKASPTKAPAPRPEGRKPAGPVIRVAGRGPMSQPQAVQGATVAARPAARTGAVRAAESREDLLRAARLRRQEERKQQVEDERKAKEAKKEYQRRYKANTRKYVASMIAMPILLVTSYYLFDRVVLGNKRKDMPKLYKQTEVE